MKFQPRFQLGQLVIYTQRHGTLAREANTLRDFDSEGIESKVFIFVYLSGKTKGYLPLLVTPMPKWGAG